MRLDPSQKWQSLGYRGLCWLKKGDHYRAIKDFDEAIKYNPLEPGIFINRGNSWINIGEYDRAVDDFTEAIRLEPKSDVITAHAYFNRGLARSSKGQYSFATKDWTEAIRLDPTDSRAHNWLAWVFATCKYAEYRDGEKAVEYGVRACELTNWKDDKFIGTLAAAYAENGDFEEAVKLLGKAIKMSPEKNKALHQRMLELFKQAKGYRTSSIR